MGDWYGAAASAFGSLIGGITSYNEGIKNRNAIAKANAQNIAYQREFAKNGIQWRVQDARNAGINPMYALGAQGASFTPTIQAETNDNNVANIIANAGGELAQFFSNKNQLELKKEAMELDLKQAETNEKHTQAQIDYLKAQTAKLNAQNAPKQIDKRDYTTFNGKQYQFNKVYDLQGTAFTYEFLRNDDEQVSIIIGFRNKDLQQAWADGSVENRGLMAYGMGGVAQLFGFHASSFINGNTDLGNGWYVADGAGLPGMVIYKNKDKPKKQTKIDENAVRQAAEKAIQDYGYTD